MISSILVRHPNRCLEIRTLAPNEDPIVRCLDRIDRRPFVSQDLKESGKRVGWLGMLHLRLLIYPDVVIWI
jgi:hypothetical protein